MRAAIGMSLVWCGCAIQSPSKPEPPAAPGVEPRVCAQVMTMTATSSDPPTSVPLALDTAGVDLCIRLDPAMFTRARFRVSSPLVDGSSSTVAARLEDATFVPFLDGADESSGTQTRMALDWLPPDHQLSDVIVWLRATVDEPVSTTVEISFFDPLD